MRYGITDLGREMLGQGRERFHSDLRPGEFFAVKDATFQVRRGECLGMLGPNGAGKSTMLKMINGLVRPSAGTIAISGQIGAMIELGTGFNPVLSGRENVYINAAVLGISKQEVTQRMESIVEFAELSHVIDEPIRTYSSGMKMRLGFSIGANLRPELLLIDEVLAVGDVGFRMKCFAHLRQLVSEGVAIILVTHAVSMLNRVANRAIVFGHGNIVHDGDLETGCTVYEEAMGASEREAVATADEQRRELGIDSIEIVDEDGNPRPEFTTGETVCLRIVVSSSKSSAQSFENLNLVAALFSPVHGRIFATSMAWQQMDFSLQAGQSVTVTLRFEKTQLLLGAYHFNISLYGREPVDFHQRLSGKGNFRVIGPPLNSQGRGINGIVKLPHRWTIDQT